MIPVKDIRTHPVFENLLRIDEEDQARLTRKMAEEGFFESEPVVLGFWAGIDGDKPVIIDGHRRWHSAVANGIEVIPCVIETFADLLAGLRRAITLQMERRQNHDSTLYSLTENFDELMERGRPSKGEDGNKLLPYGSNFSGRSASARRTAKIIGCNYRKIDKIRRIRRDGTTEIQDAVRNGDIGIEKAHSMIRDMQLGEDENKRNAAHTRAVKKVLTEENFEKIEGLPGDMFEKMNAAVEVYLRSLDDDERGPDREE
jgi:ParB-like chromosome segregation protein Spo0J